MLNLSNYKRNSCIKHNSSQWECGKGRIYTVWGLWVSAAISDKLMKVPQKLKLLLYDPPITLRDIYLRGVKSICYRCFFTSMLRVALFATARIPSISSYAYGLSPNATEPSGQWAWVPMNEWRICPASCMFQDTKFKSHPLWSLFRRNSKDCGPCCSQSDLENVLPLVILLFTLYLWPG